MLVTEQKRGSLRSIGFSMQHISEHSLRVLVVDDDKVDRMSLRRVLKDSGYEAQFSEAMNAESALSFLENQAFDCVFVDYDLPGKNGLELIRTIRARDILVPVIALTGQGNEQTAVDIMKAGASDYLTKSKLSADVVALSLRGALRVHQAEMIAIKANMGLREKNLLLEEQNRELEKQRRHIHKQNLQLQEVSRLKSEFLATMSHELRTPLNAIIGFSQILMSGSKGELNETQEKMTSRVLANGENLLALINDILDFSKLEAGRLVLEPADLNVASLVEKTVDELHSLAAQKHLPIEITVDMKNPVIFNDDIRIRQILVNLLSNAIKFTDVGSIRVILEESDKPMFNPDAVLVDVVSADVALTDTLSEDSGSENSASLQNDCVTITVEDTGCGISEDSVAYIFDPFRQVDQRLTRQHGGTGLGLTIVGSLVNMMKGKIVVDSDVHRGTTVSVMLPRTVISDV